MDRTPTNVMVHRIDFGSTVENATAELNRDPSKFGIKDLAEGQRLLASVSFDWGYIETSEGIYVLCDEGVGNDAATQTFTFEIHYSTYEGEDQKSFSLFPVASFTLTPDQVREKASGEVVPLHEFIRHFGRRLEANYSSWRVKLERIYTETVTA